MKQCCEDETKALSGIYSGLFANLPQTFGSTPPPGAPLGTIQHWILLSRQFAAVIDYTNRLDLNGCCLKKGCCVDGSKALGQIAAAEQKALRDSLAMVVGEAGPSGPNPGSIDLWGILVSIGQLAAQDVNAASGEKCFEGWSPKEWSKAEACKWPVPPTTGLISFLGTYGFPSWPFPPGATIGPISIATLLGLEFVFDGDNKCSCAQLSNNEALFLYLVKYLQELVAGMLNALTCRFNYRFPIELFKTTLLPLAVALFIPLTSGPLASILFPPNVPAIFALHHFYGALHRENRRGKFCHPCERSGCKCQKLCNAKFDSSCACQRDLQAVFYALSLTSPL